MGLTKIAFLFSLLAVIANAADSESQVGGGCRGWTTGGCFAGDGQLHGLRQVCGDQGSMERECAEMCARIPEGGCCRVEPVGFNADPGCARCYIVRGGKESGGSGSSTMCPALGNCAGDGNLKLTDSCKCGAGVCNKNQYCYDNGTCKMKPQAPKPSPPSPPTPSGLWPCVVGQGERKGLVRARGVTPQYREFADQGMAGCQKKCAETDLCAGVDYNPTNDNGWCRLFARNKPRLTAESDLKSGFTWCVKPTGPPKCGAGVVSEDCQCGDGVCPAGKKCEDGQCSEVSQSGEWNCVKGLGPRKRLIYQKPNQFHDFADGTFGCQKECEKQPKCMGIDIHLERQWCRLFREDAGRITAQKDQDSKFLYCSPTVAGEPTSNSDYNCVDNKVGKEAGVKLHVDFKYQDKCEAECDKRNKWCLGYTFKADGGSMSCMLYNKVSPHTDSGDYKWCAKANPPTPTVPTCGAGLAAEDCQCGDLVCPAGNKCDNGKCTEVPTCNGVATAECVCGEALCPAGNKCENGKCTEVPAGPPACGDGAITADCQCGEVVCPQGTTCDPEFKHCANVEGFTIVAPGYGACTGPDEEVVNGIYRDEQSLAECVKKCNSFGDECIGIYHGHLRGYDRCWIYGPNSISDGRGTGKDPYRNKGTVYRSAWVKLASDCTEIGTTDGGTGTCYKKEICGAGRITAKCLCGTNECPKGKFCNNGKCEDSELECKNVFLGQHNSQSSQTKIQACCYEVDGANPGAKISDSYRDACVAQHPSFHMFDSFALSASGANNFQIHKTSPNNGQGWGAHLFVNCCAAIPTVPACGNGLAAEDCKCGDAVCPAGNKCEDGQCNEVATCEDGPLEEECMCGGALCPAGNSCADGECVEEYVLGNGANAECPAGYEYITNKTECMGLKTHTVSDKLLRGRGRASCWPSTSWLGCFINTNNDLFFSNCDTGLLKNQNPKHTPVCKKSPPPEWHCTKGLGQYNKLTAKPNTMINYADGSLGCQRLCEESKTCMGIDYSATLKNGICRLFRTDNPRLGKGDKKKGYVYCSPTVPPTPDCGDGLAAEDCQCGDDVCPAGNKCEEGECTEVTTCDGFATDECLCGEALCPAGNKCEDGECTEVETCTEGLVSAECACGEELCPEGSKCDAGSCVEVPECEGLANAECVCGEALCPAGTKCEDGQCTEVTTCEEGVVDAECACGEQLCPAESVCSEGSCSACKDDEPGLVALMQIPITCAETLEDYAAHGVDICQEAELQKYCCNSCRKNEEFTNRQNKMCERYSKNCEKCHTGGDCVWYPHKKKCYGELYFNKKAIWPGKVDAADVFFKDQKCLSEYPSCEAFSTEECKCGDVVCPEGNNKCHEGQCATVEICENRLVTTDCACGESLCPSGHECNDGICQEILSCPRNQVIVEDCKCGDAVCTEGTHCRGGVCLNVDPCAVGELEGYCSCGTAICADGDVCVAGACKAPFECPESYVQKGSLVAQNSADGIIARNNGMDLDGCEKECDDNPNCFSFSFGGDESAEPNMDVCIQYSGLKEKNPAVAYSNMVLCVSESIENCDDRGHVLLFDCKCGDVGCPQGHLCKDNQCTNPPECPGDEFTDVECKCGAEVCPEGSRCDNDRCTDLPDCADSTNVLTGECVCEEEVCPAGSVCSEGVCEPAPACENGPLNPVECKCGEHFCPENQYCEREQCSETPKVCDAGKASNDCACGDKVCVGGEYCYDNGCHTTPKQCDENDDTPHSGPCTCGTLTCAAGKYCYEGQCKETPKPPQCEAGKVENTECICASSGLEICPVGDYCHEDGSCQENPEECTTHETDPVDADCMCGENFCPWGKYCYDGVCENEAKPQYGECVGAEKILSICFCGEIECDAGKFCLVGTCSDDPAECDATEFETAPIAVECMCGDTKCDTGKYCVDGECQDTPKRPVCAASGTVAISDGICNCFGTECATGQYCYDGACANEEKVCEQNAWELVDSKCMCEGTECEAYCFQDECFTEPRKKCLSGLVVTDDDVGYKEAGRYFGFEDTAAAEFFDTPGYSSNIYPIYTSRGYKGKIKVYKSSKYFGEGGRFNPYSKTKKGQWKNGDIICLQGSDEEEETLKPHSIEDCVNELQVTNGYPGKYMQKGMYFGFDNECMDKWYGSPNWHYKKVDIKSADGTKIATAQFFKNNSLCKMSCGRWDPTSLKKKGDWKINDLIVRANQLLPHTPEMCQGQLKVGKELWSGKNFCVDNACVEAFLGLDSDDAWPATLEIKTQEGKVGTAALFKNNSLCKCSCMRWDTGKADGDWVQGHLVYHAHPLPVHTPEMCTTQLQVKKAKWSGKQFCVDNECAEKFLGVAPGASWPAKVEVKTKGDKTGVLALFKDNDICKCSCARWDPKDLRQEGDWSFAQLVYHDDPHCVTGRDQIATACKCGGTVCPVNNYCYEDECIAELPPPPPTPRCVETPRPASYLNIDPVIADSSHPGHYFKFSVTAADIYFESSKGWNWMGDKWMINSCGETYKLKLMRNSRGCDTTSDPLQCGRILANTVPVNDVWSYEHVGANMGQQRWIAVVDPPTGNESDVGGDNYDDDLTKYKGEPGNPAIGEAIQNNLGKYVMMDMFLNMGTTLEEVVDNWSQFYADVGVQDIQDMSMDECTKKVAALIFSIKDTNDDGTLDRDELTQLYTKMNSEADSWTISDNVEEAMDDGDYDSSGGIDVDEFMSYFGDIEEKNAESQVGRDMYTGTYLKVTDFCKDGTTYTGDYYIFGDKYNQENQYKNSIGDIIRFMPNQGFTNGLDFWAILDGENNDAVRAYNAGWFSLQNDMTFKTYCNGEWKDSTWRFETEYIYDEETEVGAESQVGQGFSRYAILGLCLAIAGGVGYYVGNAHTSKTLREDKIELISYQSRN